MRSSIASTLFTFLSAVMICHGAAAQDGRRLFVEQCARCHGETGDGHGTETLDRPARSFQDGGFSFGDTELAIYRTITHGIPGSPMPSFADGLSDDQRHGLAAYVRTLCPPREDVSEEDTELLVGDHSLAAKGLLPPVVEGARDHARGLLLGTSDGLTFEYRADTLRLLAVRQGPFARRSDWTGRGGTPLQPLGTVIWLNEGGDPPGMFFVGAAATDSDEGATARQERDGPEHGSDSVRLQPLQVVPISVSTPDAGATITSKLVDADGRTVGQVTEAPRRLSTSFGPGFSRSFSVSLHHDARTVVLLMPWTHREGSFGGDMVRWLTEAERRPDIVGAAGVWHDGELRVLSWTAGVIADDGLDGFGRLTFTADDTNRRCTIDLHVLPLPHWPDDPQALAGELLR